MAEAYLFDKKEILPCAALLEGEYGVKGFYVGVPVLIGAGGVETVIEIDLTAGEKAALAESTAHVHASWSKRRSASFRLVIARDEGTRR
jgi:malate dehydrogenase